MDAIAAFFTRNIGYVYFFYGLAFFALGLVVFLESGRASEFRFARAMIPLALFGLVHGAHEWFEMFQIFAAHGAGHPATLAEELFRVASLSLSFFFLLVFGMRLLPGAELHPRAAYWQVGVFIALWLGAVLYVQLRWQPTPDELVVAADVLSRYILGISGAILACWALLRERRDFHARGMSVYGQALLWAALAFFVYGVIGQLFVRPSIIAPSQIINTALFVRTFGLPVQLLRGLAATAITITLASALRAFEAESRLRLMRAQKARIEAQAAALDAQQRRTQEVETLNTQLSTTMNGLTALVEMSRVLSSTIILDRVTHYALHQIAHSFEQTAGCRLYLKRGDGILALADEYQKPNAAIPAQISPSEAVAQRSVAAGLAAGVAAEDAGLTTLIDIDPEGINPPCDQTVGYRIIATPLLAQGEIIGSIVISAQPAKTPFSVSDASLLVALGRQVIAFIENARLYQVVQEREARLANLVQQLVNSQEVERQRIARELHDETGQKLSALALGLAAVDASLAAGDAAAGRRALQNLRQVNDGAITELRNIMSDLRPALLDDLGLVPALRSYVQQFADRYPQLAVSLTAERLPQRLAPEYETVLFRVVQEALTNVTRHAHASRVTVILEHRPRSVHLEVSDNGIGFDPAASGPGTAGEPATGRRLGLVGMRERVMLVGGEWRIVSAPGQGTRIVVELTMA